MRAMASGESKRAPQTESDNGVDSESSTNGNFECNICLDNAHDAVVSMCGHLFCWPCLHRWLETQGRVAACPVCKAGISRDRVVPLYGRGAMGADVGSQPQDPRDRVPPRPAGQRSEPEHAAGGGAAGGGLFGNGVDGQGFHMSFGIGAFPFGLFASTFNLTGGSAMFGQPASGTHGVGADNVATTEEETFLAKVFLYVAMLFVFWLIIA